MSQICAPPTVIPRQPVIHEFGSGHVSKHEYFATKQVIMISIFFNDEKKKRKKNE
jgi:hypothetical protein